MEDSAMKVDGPITANMINTGLDKVTKREYYVHVQFGNNGRVPMPKSKSAPWGRVSGEVQVEFMQPAPFPSDRYAPPSPVPMAPPMPGEREYVYTAKLTEAEVAEINNHGMLAVVDSPKSGMALVLVTKAEQLDYSDYNGQYRSIVQLVDTAPYEEAKAKAARRVAIKKHLARLAEEAKERIKMEDLLGDNAEAAALFAELKDL